MLEEYQWELPRYITTNTRYIVSPLVFMAIHLYSLTCDIQVYRILTREQVCVATCMDHRMHDTLLDVMCHWATDPLV
jgi:hypothetical protein